MYRMPSDTAGRRMSRTTKDDQSLVPIFAARVDTSRLPEVGYRPTPAKAERVAGWIRVDLEELGRVGVVGRFQDPCAPSSARPQGCRPTDSDAPGAAAFRCADRGNMVRVSCTPEPPLSFTSSLCQSWSASTVAHEALPRTCCRQQDQRR
jgi:hypothetical protein